MNIKRLLIRSIKELSKQRISSPELEAKILLTEAIKKDTAFVFSHPEYLIPSPNYKKFRRLVRKRKSGEPIAFVLGQKEFFGLNFIVNKSVLIPRPETEWLVEEGSRFLNNNKTRKRLNVIDVGTGSGCIIISLVKNLQEGEQNRINFYASDISKNALRVARKNAKIHNASKIHFYLSDLFANKRLPNSFDLIIANLPYVPYSANNKSIKFEPQEAIFADNKGMAVVKQFLEETIVLVNNNGLILIETDHTNARDIEKYAKSIFKNAKINLIKDLAGFYRYITIKK